MSHWQRVGGLAAEVVRTQGSRGGEQDAEYREKLGRDGAPSKTKMALQAAL